MCPDDDLDPTDDEAILDEIADYELSGEEGGEHLEVDDPFFVSKQAAAVFKHKFLKTYFPKFAGKAASTEIDKRLVYVDTHAGRGEYGDGTPGSPLLIAQNVTGMTQRQIDCFFIERNRSNFRCLERVLKAAMPKDAVWVARRGQASRYLTEAVEFAGNAPLFVFVDPYGLGPTFNEVVAVLRRRREGYGRKTEVLLNFISSAFSRVGGYLAHDEPKVQEVRTLEHLDEVLDGAWWREVYRNAESPGRAVAQIAERYAEKMAKATGCLWTLVPVFSRAHHDVPIYWLLHFTYHPDGQWWIGEAAAQAAAEWRQYLNPPSEPNDNMLFQLEDPFPEEERLRQRGWVDEIERNARAILAEKGRIDVRAEAKRLFGGSFGFAWSKHLREALARLHKEGLMTPKPLSKDLEKYVGTRG